MFSLSEALADKNSSGRETIWSTHVKRRSVLTKPKSTHEHTLNSLKKRVTVGKIAKRIRKGSHQSNYISEVAKKHITLSRGDKIQQPLFYPINRHETGEQYKPCYLVNLILFLFYMLIQLLSVLQSSTNNLHNREWRASLNCLHKVTGHNRLGLSEHGCFSHNKFNLPVARTTIFLSAAKNIITDITTVWNPPIRFPQHFFCGMSSCPLDTLCVCCNSLAMNHHYTYMTLPSATITLHHLKGHQLKTP